jgi:ABC-type phosphate transport system permease subunit
MKAVSRTVQTLKTALKDRKAFTQVVTGLISIVVSIAIGAIIFAMLTNALGQFQLTGQAQETVTSLFNMTWVAYGLLVIIPIIAVASVILAILQGGRERRR